MAGIVNSDATCNTHNALSDIPYDTYACGVTFSFKDRGFAGFGDGYGVVSLQECCDMVNASLLRIPGNTGCEIQYCQIPAATTTSTVTVYAAYATGTATAAQTPAPYVTTSVTVGPPEKVDTCMRFVYEGDLPDDVADGISNVGSWSVARFSDTDIRDDEAAVPVVSAPASWTSAAADPWASALSSASASRATATTTASSDGMPSLPGRRGLTTSITLLLMATSMHLL